MKKLFVNIYGKSIATLISLIGILAGFGSCIGDQPVEYGTPNADFVIAGTVKDAATSKPINKIRIVVQDKQYPTYGIDTVYTDENGNYEIKFKDMPDIELPYKVVASDADGSNNGGLFKSDTLKIEFTKSDRIKSGSGNWYDGIYKKTNQNFSLKESGVIAMYGVMGTSYKENEEK